jgi:hypothetical protein
MPDNDISQRNLTKSLLHYSHGESSEDLAEFVRFYGAVNMLQNYVNRMICDRDQDYQAFKDWQAEKYR